MKNIVTNTSIKAELISRKTFNNYKNLFVPLLILVLVSLVIVLLVYQNSNNETYNQITNVSNGTSNLTKTESNTVNACKSLDVINKTLDLYDYSDFDLSVSNYTTSDLPIFIKRDNDEPYVSFKSDLQRVVLLGESSEHSVDKLEAEVGDKINEDFSKMGYSLIRKSTPESKEYIKLREVIELDIINLLYVYKKGNELIQVRINGSGYGTNQTTLSLYCAKDISEENDQYDEFIDETDVIFGTTDSIDIEFSTVSIWERSKDVYNLNLGSMIFVSGYSNYIAKIEGGFVSLYQGQDLPYCSLFEDRKVGEGISCNDAYTGEIRVVSY